MRLERLSNSDGITAKKQAIITASDSLFQSESGKIVSGDYLYINGRRTFFDKTTIETAGLLSSQRFKLEGEHWHNQGQVTVGTDAFSLKVASMQNEGTISAGGKTLVQREWSPWSPWAPLSSGQPRLKWE